MRDYMRIHSMRLEGRSWRDIRITLGETVNLPTLRGAYSRWRKREGV